MNSIEHLSMASSFGNVIPGQHVKVVKPTTSSALASTKIHGSNTNATGSCKEPRITITKEGESVRAIEIECTCGEVIRLECAY